MTCNVSYRQSTTDVYGNEKKSKSTNCAKKLSPHDYCLTLPVFFTERKGKVRDAEIQNVSDEYFFNLGGNSPGMTGKITGRFPMMCLEGFNHCNLSTW